MSKNNILTIETLGFKHLCLLHAFLPSIPPFLSLPPPSLPPPLSPPPSYLSLPLPSLLSLSSDILNYTLTHYLQPKQCLLQFSSSRSLCSELLPHKLNHLHSIRIRLGEQSMVASVENGHLSWLCAQLNQ